jgi:hypothetical protein
MDDAPLPSHLDGLELAWGLIANAGEGNWDRETPEWKAAAERWRDEVWHPALASGGDWVWQLVYECAGAATRPMLEDHPHYVFPAERVADAVREVMVSKGFTPPVGYQGDMPVPAAS